MPRESFLFLREPRTLFGAVTADEAKAALGMACALRDRALPSPRPLPRSDDRIRGLASQFRQMIELGLEPADPRRRRAQFDDEVADFGLGDQRAQGFPALPALARLEAQIWPRRPLTSALARASASEGT